MAPIYHCCPSCRQEEPGSKPYSIDKVGDHYRRPKIKLNDRIMG